MAAITVILVPIEPVPSKYYASPLLVRDGQFKVSRTSGPNWDDIVKWVSEGYSVTLRPPTAEEAKTLAPELEKLRAVRIL